MTGKRKFGAFLLVAGSAAAAFFTLQTFRFTSQASRASGRITELTWEPGNSGKSRTAVVEFMNSGRPVRFHVSLRKGRYAAGDTVPVLYLASRPSEARLDDFWSLWTTTGVALLFACLGLIPFTKAEDR